MKATAGTSFSQPPIPINGSDFPPLSVSTRVEVTSLQVLGTGKIQYLDRLHIYLTSKICSHLQVREQAPSHRWKEKIQCRVVLCYLADLRMESHLIKHCTPVTFHSLSCPVRDSRNSNGHLNAKPQLILVRSIGTFKSQILPMPSAPLTLLVLYFSACQAPQVMANEKGL